jgi:hypothetical protein
MSAQPSELSARIIDLFGNPATADPTKLFGNLTVLPSGIVQIGSASGLQLPDGYTTVITPQGRNRIINGDCRIAQRASAVLSSPIGNTYGGPDRFSSANSTGGGQFTQSAGTITFGGATLPAIVLTANTANTAVTGSNYWYGILHQIEACNCYDLVGKPVTVSFIFSTNVAGTYNVSLRCGATTYSCVQTFTAVAGVQQITIPFPAIPTATAFASSTASGIQLCIGFINTGTYVTATTNAWQVGNYLTTAACTNWGLAANNFIAATNIQLEVGTQATPFEFSSVNDQYLRCLRYYQPTFGDYETYQTSGQNFIYSVPLMVPMRTAPTASTPSGGSLGGGAAAPTCSATSQRAYWSSNVSGATGASLLATHRGCQQNCK